MSNNKQQTAVKLYTEEQVLEIIGNLNREYFVTSEELLEEMKLTSIELPSDEEIEQSSLKWFMTANKHEIIFDLGWMKIFEAGAKYAINKIQGGNK
jgi:hypothetical protein